MQIFGQTAALRKSLQLTMQEENRLELGLFGVLRLVILTLVLQILLMQYIL